VTDDLGRTLAAVHAYADGRANLALTFDSNPYLLHTMLLSYGVVNWVTNGLFIGERHVYVSPQIDDLFLENTQCVGTRQRAIPPGRVRCGRPLPGQQYIDARPGQSRAERRPVERAAAGDLRDSTACEQTVLQRGGARAARGDAGVRPPTANAGPSHATDLLLPVTLTGSGTDPNVPSRPLTFAWTQSSGPSVSLVNANGPVVTFTAPDLPAGSPPVALGFTLTVSNGLLSATATTRVVVRFLPPTCRRGRSLLPGHRSPVLLWS
jgi:hypothetical protein